MRLKGLVWALVGLLVGCAPVSKPGQSTAQLPPVGANRIEARWATALQGLRLNRGMISVVGVLERNRPAAVAKCGEAERVLATNHRVRAAELFAQAIRLDDRYAPGFEGLARCLLVDGPADWPVPLLRIAIALDPNFDKARFELGAAFHMRGDFAGALAAWRELARRNAAYPDVHVRIAIACYNRQDRPGAIQAMAEAKRRSQHVPPQFEALLNGEGQP